MKKPIIPIIILIVLLLAGGAFFLSRRQTQTSLTGAATTDVSGQPAASGVEKFTGSVMDLLKRNTAMKCTASSDEPGAGYNGTYYIDPSTGRTRIDMESQVAEGKPKVLSHMIADKDYLYSWQEGQKTGMKLSTKTEAGTSTESETGETAGTPQEAEKELSKESDYSCSPWVLDAAMFTPPSDVTFQDFSETMKQFAGPSGVSEDQVKDLIKQYGAGEETGE